jgi:dTMP kinase
MNAARAQLVEEKLAPALKAGRHVICDRYYPSTLAYQGGGRGLPCNELLNLITFAIPAVPGWPDRVILIRTLAANSAVRQYARNQVNCQPTDRFESSDVGFFLQVDQKYTDLAQDNPDLFRVVDGNGSVAEVQALVWEAVKDLFI